MKKWHIGAKIWFGFYILCQWLMFIEFATKPVTATNAAYQQVTLMYGFSGLIGTVLILWLAISHRKMALNILIVVAAVGAALTLIQGNTVGALSSLILPAINWLVARKGVAET